MGIDVLSHCGPLSHISAPLGDAGLLIVFLLAAGVTAMTFVGFSVWLAYHLIRVVVVLLARLLLIPCGGCRKRATKPPARIWLACPDPVCRTVNPDHARFCRQCGRMIHKTIPLAA